ncbi:family 2 encapsulin nanocompartment cargo protein polyprenyl transferase [Actinophytocola xinjiangensis]|uniref:family 2 encapsulin nanocompartment cargo protein polyprenyl transferase n=1 Tax=Actinophytocola xinjiangensis TaxID=485602 RepID=UPI000ADDD4FC|nr:family 2 encapsulin nanocompartment cargo protein polyprenyl transferase [Actinophytocola xinjiangensis]
MAAPELHPGASYAQETLAWSRAMIDPALRAAVDTLPESMRRISGYHLGWSDEHGEEVTAPAGKAIRPTLVLLSAAVTGGSPREAVPAAVAVELVHNFSLLHDDVMDGDATRRHRPTAWRLFGVGAAILAGDAMLTLALDVLAASGHAESGRGMRMLSAAVQDLVDGQSADMDFEQRDTVEPAECQTMAAHKTAALIGCSCALGALFGGASDTAVGRLRTFGEHLGLAFQHVDDLLGIWGDSAVTGKPVFSDLRNRKKSLPVVFAMASDSAPGRELAALYGRSGPLSDEEVARAASLVADAGGRDWSQAEADRLLAHALDQLDHGDHGIAATELAALARLVTRRDH